MERLDGVGEIGGDCDWELPFGMLLRAITGPVSQRLIRLTFTFSLLLRLASSSELNNGDTIQFTKKILTRKIK